jgi:endoglucanase
LVVMKETFMFHALARLVAFSATALSALGCYPASRAADAPNASGDKTDPDLAACPGSRLDDGEDGNNQILASAGRGGYWYTYADKTGSTIVPPSGDTGGTFAMSEGGAHGSALAARMQGKVGGGGIVFVGMGFSFVDPKGPYDASKFKGIAFFAKAGEKSSTSIRVKVPDVNTDKDGKVCTECYNDFGVDLNLTTTWKRYVVPFARMSQLAGWGAPHTAAIDASKLYGIQWQVASPGAAYDVWIDDPELVDCR